MQHAVDDREAAERERERGAQARAERREREQPGDRRGERDRPGQRVLAEAEPRAAMHERVVERVHEHEQRREGEHERLAGAVAAHRASASSKKPTTRRSYSCGRASSPPTWFDSGISHSVLLLARRGVVEAVELLADALHRRGDQQERLVDPAGQVLQMLRRQLVRGHGDRCRLERGDRSAQHLLDARQVLVHVLRVRARTGALGDHGLEPRRSRRRSRASARRRRRGRCRRSGPDRRRAGAGGTRSRRRRPCRRPSPRSSAHLRSRPRRGGRTAARRSRAGRACAPAAAGRCGRGRRSRPRRSSTGCTSPRARARRRS